MAPTDRRLNALLLAAHQTLSRAQPGSQQHTLATSALHKLRHPYRVKKMMPWLPSGA